MNTQRTHALALTALSTPPASPDEEFPASEAYQRALDISRTARAALRGTTQAMRRTISQHTLAAVRSPAAGPEPEPTSGVRARPSLPPPAE